MTGFLPASLADWREAPRARALNGAPLRDAPYILCWL